MSLETLERPRSAFGSWTGVVRHLHLAPRAFLPMRAVPEVTLTEGRGIEGDRYNLALEAGFYSHKPEVGRQITLFEIETSLLARRHAAPGNSPINSVPAHRRDYREGNLQAVDQSVRPELPNLTRGRCASG